MGVAPKRCKASSSALLLSIVLTSWLKPRLVGDRHCEVGAQFGNSEELHARITHDILDQDMLWGYEFGLGIFGYWRTILCENIIVLCERQ